MRKILFTLLAVLFAAPCVRAADAAASLDFYKKQSLTLSAQLSREERAFAKTLANGIGTWVKQNPKNASVPEAGGLEGVAGLRENGEFRR